MSPVFRHGLLRLYLLKLLDEEPRHGYDVIRLLQDRFLGVYSPSPGTIYPRLARLEEEGLVTHDLIDGKKVYRITDAGRAELNSRLDDLADLEDQLSASVRGIAREISRDVRETVRSLREELTWAVREAGRTGREPGTTSHRDMADDQPGDQDGADQTAEQAGDRPPGDWRERLSWREWASWAERPDWREWAHWARQQDWKEWADWARPPDWSDVPGKREWREQAKSSKQEWKEQAQAWKDQARASKQQWRDQSRVSGADRASGKPRDRCGPDRDLAADLEQLVAAFANQIRNFARHAEVAGDDAVISLGRILGDTLSRIITEVLGVHGPSGDKTDERSQQARSERREPESDQAEPRKADPERDEQPEQDDQPRSDKDD